MTENSFKFPKLKGSINYDIWSIRMSSLLAKEDFNDLIISDLSDITLADHDKYQDKADKVTSLIKLALEDGPLLQTRFITNPYILWTTLKSLYEAKGFSSDFILSKELINTTLNTFKGNLEEFLNSFIRIKDNLEAKDIKLPTKFLVALLLNHLSKEYDYIVAIITQNIRVNENFKLDDIMIQLLDEARRINSIKTKNYSYNRISSNYYYNNSNNSSNRNSTSKNSTNSSSRNSGYFNDVEMTMQTNGQNNKKPINKNNNNYSNNKNCNYCNLKGHLEDNCFKKYPHLKNKNNKKSINTTSKKIKNKREETILVTSSTTKNSTSTIDFILDSGATIHTCYIKELFSNLKDTNISIKWGNTSNYIKASGIGDINIYFLNKLVTLKNILYIPELGVNLLSLNLITSKNYKLSFNKDNCFIYNPNNTILAKGYYKNGVSVFSATKNTSTNKSLITLNTINSNSNIEDYSDSELDLIDPTLEEITIDKSINLDNNLELNNNNNSNLEDATINNNNNSSIDNLPSKEIVISKDNSISYNNNTIELIHNRLGHININAIKNLNNNTLGINLNNSDINTAKVSINDCKICIQSKLTENISKIPSNKVTSYLDLIYIDIGGPISPKTFRGYKYYITFRDSFTKYLVVKLLKSRKNIVNIVELTINELELEAKDNSSNSSNTSNNNFSNNKVKALQLDNEFKSNDLTNYLNSKGIITRFSAPYNPSQNGAAEIINKVLFNKVRALLINSNLPKSLWGEAILTATYLYNRTPNSSINYKTPYYLKYNKLPNLSNIKIFGSLTYHKEPKDFIKKLDPRATIYYLIGFNSNNLYKLYNPRNNKSIISRDCKILEGYYYKPNNNKTIYKLFEKLEDISKDIATNNKNTKNSIIINKPNKAINIDSDSEDELANITSINYYNKDIIIEDNNANFNINKIILNTIELNNNKNDYKSLYNKSILENILLSSNNSNLIDPKSFKEVLLNPNKDLYLAAMKLETDDLINNNTWDLIINPNTNNNTSNTRIIKGRWVLNKKLNLDGSIKKYKARWVAKGFLQQYNINYKETFASTSKPSLIRLLLSIFSYLDWEIYNWDIKQAFPNAKIDNNNILVELPIGFEDYILNIAKNNNNSNLSPKLLENIKAKNYKNIVCRLNKALYGLKQASRQWQLFLTKILEKLDFTTLKIDNSIFIHKNKSILLATHVDDILVFAKTKELVNNLYLDLTKISKLGITNLGEIKEFLGVEIIRNRSNRSIAITQKSFINKVLNKYNKTLNKEKSIPLPIGIKLNKNLEDLNNNTIIKDYQKQIGSLIYLTIFTRPDLVYSVNYLARFMTNPSLEHYKYLNYIFSYLNKTKDLSLDLTLYPYNQNQSKYNTSNLTINSINLLGISDSDWGGDLDSRKSTTGNIFILRNIKDNNAKNIAISWQSKLQKTVAISSAEAEYMALKEATKESLYLQNFIKELFSYKIFNSYNIFNKVNIIKTDSLSAIELAKNPIYHARTKHVDITYHFVRENLLSNKIELVYENTSTILADNLTKPINYPKFQDFKFRIGLERI